MARLIVPPALLRDADGREVVELSGATIGEALDRLETELPRLERRLRDDRGALREHVQLVLGATNIRDLAGLDTALGDAADLHVVPA